MSHSVTFNSNGSQNGQGLRNPETSAKAGGFVFVPVLRVNQFRPRGGREENREHLRATLLKFAFQRCPCHAVLSVLIESIEAALQFGLLGAAER